MRYRILSAAAFLLCGSVVMAEDKLALPFADADDLPTVLSATRLNQSLFDAPAAVTVIDRQMIEQSGVREIPEILRMVPGMVVGYESGSEAFVSYHGTSADLARRMQVLVDGRSIYQPLLASVDWIGLPVELADIERIEVIRGPNAASYGVNSFFAVVNIITRHPADVAGSSITLRSGENGIEDYHARVAQRDGNVDWRLSIAGRSDDGFVDNNRENDTDFTDSKSVDSVYGQGVWAVDANNSLEFGFGRSAMESQQQYRAEFFLEPPVTERDNRFVSLAWDSSLSDTHQLRVQANYSQFSRKEPWVTGLPPVVFHPALGELYAQNRSCATGALDNDFSSCQAADLPLLISLGAVVADPDYTTERVFTSGNYGKEARTEIDLQDTWVFSPALRSVFGVSYDNAEVDSTTYLDGKEGNVVWGLFAHAEWQLASRWLLNVGGSQEFDKDAGDYFSPRAALNWQFTDSQVLRVVYSEAVRTPDILETSADWSYESEDLLDPASGFGGTFFQTGQSTGAPTETIESSELGYYARFDQIKLSADIRLFYDRMELAEHNLEIEGFEIRPVEPFEMRGAEVALDWRPAPSQRLQLNYAHLDMTGDLSNDNTNFVPKHSGSLGWWQDYQNGWQLGTTYYFYNNLRNSNLTANSFFFDRLDTRLARKLLVHGSQQLELAAVLQYRIKNEPELREENMAKQHVGWVSLDWRY